MCELRRVKRTQVHRRARVIAGSLELGCTVRDLTNLGAGLQVAAGAFVPECFDLIFDSRLFSRRCQLRWRSNDRLGVEFEAKLQLLR